MSKPDVRSIQVGELPEATFPPVKSAFRVHIDEAAFDHATERGAAESDREIGGVLVGRLCRDAGGPFVLVTTTIDALHADEKTAELTFTHETWAHVHEEMDRHHQGLEIVGWYHTHPGFGVFLSDRDQFIHRSFFNLPHQIALVYDPKSRDHGVFTWKEGEPVRSRRYWIGEREQVFEPAPEPVAPPGKKPETLAAKPSAAAEEFGPLADRVTLAMGAIVLLAIGGLVGWWLGGRGGTEVQALRQLEIEKIKRGASLEVTRELDTRLINALDRVMDREAVATMRRALAEIDKGLEVLTVKDPPAEARDVALASLLEGRRRLKQLAEDRAAATELIKAVAAQSRGVEDPRETRRLVGLHGAALGRICLEQAKRAEAGGDRPFARTLLNIAVQVDPNQKAHYEQMLAGLEEKK